ncbi:MAG: hypothetical protein ACFFD2_00840 [Promethearchaeota archaeon]
MDIEVEIYPDNYESFSIDIISHVYFHFLGTPFPSIKKKVGHTSYPVGTLLAARAGRAREHRVHCSK